MLPITRHCLVFKIVDLNEVGQIFDLQNTSGPRLWSMTPESLLGLDSGLTLLVLSELPCPPWT